MPLTANNYTGTGSSCPTVPIHGNPMISAQSWLLLNFYLLLPASQAILPCESFWRAKLMTSDDLSNFLTRVTTFHDFCMTLMTTGDNILMTPKTNGKDTLCWPELRESANYMLKKQDNAVRWQLIDARNRVYVIYNLILGSRREQIPCLLSISIPHKSCFTSSRPFFMKTD